MDPDIAFIAPPTAPTPPLPDGFRDPRGFGDDGPSFFDVLDIINPLQHIPVVSSIYRAVTGDEISHVPRVLGGGLFGGLFGAIAALVNVIVDEITGSDIGEHVLGFVDDLFNGSEEPTIAQRRSLEPAYPADKTDEFFPGSPAELMALQSATQLYDDAASLTALRSGAHLDVLG